MKTLVLLIASLAVASCKSGRTSQVNEFGRNTTERSELNSEYDLKSLINALGEQTKVPPGKITLQAEVLKGVTQEDKPAASNIFTEFHFSNLTEEECNALKTYHSQGYKRPSEVDCKRTNRNFFTTDFLPPAMQALEKHQFKSQKQMSGEIEAKIMANCWTTSYEIMRHRATGGFDYSVFYAGDRLVEKYFQDASYFQKGGESPLETSREFVVKNAKPGDLLQFYKDRIYHSAVIVAPGLIFEKSGFQNSLTYRLVLLDDLLRMWNSTSRVVLLRPTDKPLPHPNVFRSGEMGGNTHDDGGSGSYYFMTQIPPFVKREDGRYYLPPEAYQSSSFKLTSMAGFPLKEMKRIDKDVSVDCVTKVEAKLFESGEFGPSDKVLGTTPAGTKFMAFYQYGSLYRLSAFSYKGEMHDARSRNALWIEEKETTCTSRGG